MTAKTEIVDNLTKAKRAMKSDNVQAFGKAIDAEKLVDATGTRTMLEVLILRMFHRVDPENPSSVKMFAKALDVLSEIAPSVIFNSRERHHTIRALMVAEAASEWADGISLEKVRHALELVHRTNSHRAFDTALKAGIVDNNGRYVVHSPRAAVLAPR